MTSLFPKMVQKSDRAASALLISATRRDSANACRDCRAEPKQFPSAVGRDNLAPCTGDFGDGIGDKLRVVSRSATIAQKRAVLEADSQVPAQFDDSA
jgi:hypothetical protein